MSEEPMVHDTLHAARAALMAQYAEGYAKGIELVLVQVESLRDAAGEMPIPPEYLTQFVIRVRTAMAGIDVNAIIDGEGEFSVRVPS